jgi:hypothetical protein
MVSSMIDANPLGRGAVDRLQKPKCLIGVPLRSNTTWQSRADIEEVCSEPRHPFASGHLALMLADLGMEVQFINHVCTHYRDSRSRLLQVIDLTRAAVRSDVAICYSMMGVSATAVLSLLRRRKPPIVLYLQAALNPQAGVLKQSVHRRLLERAIRRADVVVSVLREVADRIRQEHPEKAGCVYYAPVGADTTFFDPALTVDHLPGSSLRGLRRQGYFLVAGDITRDDAFIYSSMQSRSLPIVRVTRDPRVADRVIRLAADYGRPDDILLQRTSFEDLRWLYANCNVAVFAGEDSWEPAGITSLTEALACGASCVCNAGGHIENELRGLAVESDLAVPVEFYERNSGRSLVSSVGAIRRLSPEERARRSVEARRFVRTTCSVDRSHDVLQTAVRQALEHAVQSRRSMSHLART